MGTVTIGTLKFPSLAAGKLKCSPMGVGWGGALPPTPQSLAFGLRVGCLVLNLHAPLERMRESVPMDGADDIEYSGLTWGPGKEGEVSGLCSLPCLQPDSVPAQSHRRSGTKHPAEGAQPRGWCWGTVIHLIESCALTRSYS